MQTRPYSFMQAIDFSVSVFWLGLGQCEYIIRIPLQSNVLINRLFISQICQN